jgi:hypothetical protein
MPITEHQFEKAKKFIERLVWPQKRAYAVAYLNHLATGAPLPEETIPANHAEKTRERMKTVIVGQDSARKKKIVCEK